jgi:hypothetical protein
MSAGFLRSPGGLLIPESAMDVPTEDGVALRAKGGVLQQATKGGAWSSVGGSASSSPFMTRMTALAASLATFTGQRYVPLGMYPAGVAIASRTNNPATMTGPGVAATPTPLALTNNVVQTPKVVPWFVAFRAQVTGAFAGANYALCTVHDGTNDFVRFGYAGGTSNSFWSVDVGHGGAATTGISTIPLDAAAPHDHAIFYDGSTALKYFVDGVLAVTISVLTNFPTTAQSIAAMANTTTLTATEIFAAFNES